MGAEGAVNISPPRRDRERPQTLADRAEFVADYEDRSRTRTRPRALGYVDDVIRPSDPRRGSRRARDAGGQARPESAEEARQHPAVTSLAAAARPCAKTAAPVRPHPGRQPRRDRAAASSGPAATSGVETVAVYSATPTRSWRHVRRRRGPPGPAPATDSYLRADCRRRRAPVRRRGVSTLATASCRSGRRSLPRVRRCRLVRRSDPRAIDALGDKLAARRTAWRLACPVVPGDVRAGAGRVLTSRGLGGAEGIGFPLLVEGVGRRGWRGCVVSSAIGLPAAAVGGGAGGFGDGDGVPRTACDRPRHIEVQLLGDAGTIVALGERDCSLRRAPEARRGIAGAGSDR